MTTTILTIESGYNTWYVDFTPKNEFPYAVSKDEKHRCSVKTLGEAVMFILEKTLATSLVVKS